MNKKRKIEGVIWFAVGLIMLLLLIADTTDVSTKNSNETLFSLVLLFFGKMTWFLVISAIVYGILIFFYEKMNVTRGKITAFIGCFLCLSVILIRNSVLGGTPLSKTFIEAGRELLSYGFNKQSGGVLGGIISMPFYQIISSSGMGIALIILTLLSVFFIFKDLMEFWYEYAKEWIKYSRSDEFKEKKRKLAAKKYAEKLKKTNYKEYQKQMLKEKIISSRNEKLSFEIAKKPKENFLQKTQVYSDEELKEKEKEWMEILEKKENQDKEIKENNNTKKSIVENNLKSEIKKSNTENEKKEQDSSNKDNPPKKMKLEILSPFTNKKVKKELEEDLSFQQFPKLSAFENKEVIEKEKKLEEKLKEANNLLEKNQGYDEVIKKSIEKIFKSKSMDFDTKRKIEKSIRDNVSHLESVLKEFGVDAKVVNYEYGPTITRYEIVIPKGIKVSKVTNLADDIAMNLAAESIRIEAPIPGKNTIGIETPNKIKENVHFANIIKNKELDKGELKVILGKNIVGRDKFIDIVKMPHLLIAGQTGSGKSVAVNTIISTLISKKSDKEVKFIMIDPKMVELMPYNEIPHLLVPVIIDPQKAAIALKWAVNEMENRYKKLMENGVRNIVSYNSLNFVERMPYIVIIIDELADLMMVASNSVEESIARIAQKARAVGIHLVVATQRPSTDVITGMIKANLPSRISFALRSQVDSRTILDTSGAEKLLGQGDMLLLANGSSKLERIQGAYISDEEVKNLTDTLKRSKKVHYQNEILEENEEEENDLDPFFDNAVKVIREEQKVSIAMLQRKLKVGFNRASRIYNQLKDNGVIGDDGQISSEDLE
ncbi:FtsK/SpoIIIE family DNA translocase [Leptotrichia sp. oral taxon 847]|uniref:FtsK/SpoIIIE family DNA translocase n=1 Tax=Leptotrichia sp. oral taxon 847 TaxID=1785996 RepID=UPI000767E7C2|nr:DNA translocase FtsK [Leptotrichia sp. oral taxon 847]AMD94960.1 cell division protein FtsK [Leptotrichia sp. oral taxon 847]